MIDVNRERLGQLLDEAEQTEMGFETGILPLEILSDQLHRVWAPVSHLNAVTSSPELRAAYNACLPVLARYETELGQNERLYKLYKDVSNTLADDRTDGAVQLVRHALRSFRLSGVDLPADKKARFKAIVEELSQLQARFEQNVLDSMAAWSYHETDNNALDGIPATVLEQAESNARDASLEGWLFRLDQPTYTTVITHAENRDLRFLFYKAWVTRASPEIHDGAEFDNTAIIDQILALRHELSGLVGFQNYAEYSLASKMADSVEEVQTFLQDLANYSHNTAVSELETLEQFAGQPLTAWDIAFYSEKLRLKKYSVSDEQLRPYFPVDSVLAGLFAVVGRLYGLELRQIEDVDIWQADVRYYSLVNDTGETIGGVFVDLFARPNKRSGAWMDECLIRKNIYQKLQIPVAHLVCNFAGPTETAPCLLNHDDVVTLFHEFGHTLHHLLTRVDYPSVSGINGVPWDAVELPSQFMENFAWQPEVVTMISSHYQTGESLPVELLEKLRSSRIFQAGLRMLRQLEFSLFDLQLHAEYDPESGSNMLPLLEAIRSQISVVEQPEFNRFPNSFSHIFGGGYAAGYYSYKWAEVLAADAWSAFEDEGIFSPDLARNFRQKILEIGGTEKIADAFRAFRGRAPEIQPLLRQAGITESKVT
jgi:oligopeptidase A